MSREGGGVLRQGDACTKIGRPVRELLQEKHPPLQEIDASDPIKYPFEFYKEVPDVIPLDISASYVEVVAQRLRGASGPGGADAKFLKGWYTCF